MLDLIYATGLTDDERLMLLAIGLAPILLAVAIAAGWLIGHFLEHPTRDTQSRPARRERNQRAELQVAGS
jgi:peptidoglycan/LPS O-acetylase OafA/YrhL